MAKKISKTKGLVCVSLVFVLSRRNEKAVRDFSEVFCFLFFFLARIASQFYTYGGFLTHEKTESIMGSEEHGYNHHAKPPGQSQFKWQTIIVFHLLTS